MRDIADLRQAMARDTAELVPHAGAEEILRAGRRRARRRPIAAAAGVALVALAVPVAIWSTGGGRGGVAVGVSPPAPSPSAVVTSRPGEPSRMGCPADPKTAEAIGDTIWTGVTNSEGEEIVVRFLQSDRGTGIAGFGIGLGDSATGTVTRLGCSLGFPIPPSAEGTPDARSEFDGPDFSGPDKTTTIVAVFVGPADRITATYDGRSLPVRMRKWSAHPELVVYWITGVPAGAADNPRDDAHPLVTIYDAAGKVVGPAR